MKLEFRKFTPDDIDECTTVFLSVFSREPWNDQWSSFDHAKTYLSEIVESPGFCGFIALLEGNITGVCLGRRKTWWSGPEYYVEEFYVDHAMHGMGLGTKLLNHVKASVNTEGMKAIILLTDQNLPAEKFYIKHDFLPSPNMVFMYCSLDEEAGDPE